MNIVLESDMSIEPGHQVIVLDDTVEGAALGFLLKGLEAVTPGNSPIRIHHTAEVDARIVDLIDQLSHVRFSAPGLVQMTMVEEAA